MSLEILLGLAVAATATSAPDCGSLSVGEKYPALLVLSLSGEGTHRFGVTELRNEAAEAMRSTQDYYLLPADASLDACAGSLSCIVKGVEQEAGADKPRLLVLVASRSVGTARDRVVATTIDLLKAREIAETFKAAESSELDGHISAGAILLRPEAAVLAEQDDLRDYLASTLTKTTQEIRPSGSVSLLGAVRFSGLAGGAELELDGRAVGTSPGACVNLTDVRPGRRVLRIAKTGFEDSVVAVQVSAGSHTSVSTALVRVDRTIFDRIRQPTIWEGSGLGLVGAAFLTYGIYTAASYTNSCVGVGGGCGNLGLPRLTQSGNVVGGAGDGPLTIPLGYSLVAAGLAMVTTDLFYAEEEERPWWLPPLIGLAAGATVYVVSEATLARSSQ